jgi:hypothetical protein
MVAICAQLPLTGSGKNRGYFPTPSVQRHVPRAFGDSEKAEGEPGTWGSEGRIEAWHCTDNLRFLSLEILSVSWNPLLCRRMKSTPCVRTEGLLIQEGKAAGLMQAQRVGVFRAWSSPLA